MLTMSTLMMPTTMTTMTNPGPIPAHSVPQKLEPPKLTAATLSHTPTPANKSVRLWFMTSTFDTWKDFVVRYLQYLFIMGGKAKAKQKEELRKSN
ncbi:Uncharacterized protein DBV15_06723 [Temnothorax longispinosus]|uniref:Uncharacterized protein n=1 Tax=Temnothorax longispinosus TaxID=300112 RepID=A0A4S2JQE0_9HYME|nr:Uncharacterized protein DBV15_06723 [Temnothorax longispinosus]